MRQILTRGNTLLGGMLLISLLSAAAIALDARGMMYVPGTQYASAPLAQSTGNSTPTTQSTKTTQGAEQNNLEDKEFTCQPGVDYSLTYEKGALKVRCAEKYYCPTPETTRFGGCTPPVTRAQNQTSVPTAQCTIGSAPKSTLKYCIPEEYVRQSERGKNDAGCKVISCTPGQQIKPSEVKKTEAPRLITDQLVRASDQEKQQITAALKTDQGLQDAFSKAFEEKQNEVTQQENVVRSAQEQIQELERMVQGDSSMTCSVDCPDSSGRLNEARERELAERQKLQQLQRESSVLKDTAAVLQPSTNGPGAGASQGPTKCGSQTCADAETAAQNYQYHKPPTTIQPPLCPPGRSDCYNIPAPDMPRRETSASNGGLGNILGSLFGGQQQDNYCVVSLNPIYILQTPARPGCHNYRQSPLQQLGSLLGGQQQNGQCSTMGSLFGNCQNQQQPQCTIAANPQRLALPQSGQQQQPVTLQWQAQNAVSANLSAVGAVGPSGSYQVYPQQTTTYSLQVMGYSVNAGYNTPTYNQCSVTVSVGNEPAPGTPTQSNPVASISCQPQVADAGTQVAISYACENATESTGTNFSTDGALSGSAVETMPSVGTSQIYSLKCTSKNVSHTAQCAVQINKPSIALVASPNVIQRGEQTTIGWVTSGMESCVISSPTLSAFTADNEAHTSPSGAVRTPGLSQETEFVLTCSTKSGAERTAQITVGIR